MLSVSGPDSHWGVSRYLKFPWLLEAKAETARLMRVFMDMDPREILENADDLEAWRRFHTWVRTTLKDMYPDDPDFDEDWVEGFEVHVEGCQ